MRPPSSYFGFDTEDDGAGNPFLFSVVSEDGARRTYRDAASFRDVLRNIAQHERDAGRRAEFWAVNLSYDLHNVYWPAMHETYPTFNRMGRIIAARLLGTDALFRDTVAFLPASAKQLGELVGMPKLEMPHTVPRTDPRWRSYCERDAEIAVRAGALIRDGLASVGAAMKYSAAGTALAAWESEVGAPRCPDEWARGAYYGGRVETFRTGIVNGPVHQWDVRSMYPSCMLGDFPLPGSSVDGWREGRPAWIRCRVTVPDDGRVAGPLPLRGASGGITFPVGSFTGEWVSDELENAVQLGARIERIETARTWTASCSPFAPWIRRMYGLRAQGGAVKLAAKIVMNSLYGKFGSGTEMMMVKKGDALPYRWGDAYSFGIEDKGAYPPASRFAFAAFITARARIRLLSLLNECKRPIYCDTDSVFALDDDLRSHEGAGLGELERLESAERMDILAPKVYRTRRSGKWDFKAKGIPLGLALETGEEFWETRTVHFRSPSSMREALSRNERPGIWQERQRTIRSGQGGRRDFRGGTLPPLVGE